MDPSQGTPVVFPAPVAPELVVFAATEETTVTQADVVIDQKPAFPIGLVDYNKPIVVMESGNEDDLLGNPQVLTVLKGSLYPVVVTFWKDGEQILAQFDTDGDDEIGDFKVENEDPYPRTVHVVIGREGRSLVVDSEVYSSEDAARGETDVNNIVGIFPLVIEGLQPSVSDFHDGGAEIEEEDSDDLPDTEGATSNVTEVSDSAPTEMYVAGRNRHVGETVHAHRAGFGVRVSTIVKMRRDAHKSLYIRPNDGSEPYWARNKNIRY